MEVPKMQAFIMYIYSDGMNELCRMGKYSSMQEFLFAHKIESEFSIHESDLFALTKIENLKLKGLSNALR